MDEFAAMVRQQAAEAIRPLRLQDGGRDTDPIVELVGFLLEDGAGGVLAPAEVPVTTDQWLLWHQLAMERGPELAEAMASVLQNERLELPTTADAMKEWAAWLLVSTLDWFEME